jgi:hypothetical protein
MAFFLADFTFTSVPTENLSALSPQSRVTTLLSTDVTVHLALAAIELDADAAIKKIARVVAISFFMVFSFK